MNTWKNYLLTLVLLSLPVVVSAQDEGNAELVKESVEQAINSVEKKAEEIQNEAQETLSNISKELEKTPVKNDAAEESNESSESTEPVKTDEEGDKETTEEALSPEVKEPTIDEKINAFMAPITKAFAGIIFWEIHLRELTLEDEKKYSVAWNSGDTENNVARGLYVSLPLLDDQDAENINQITFPFVLVWLLGAGIWATLYFGFPNIRFFSLAIKTVRGKYSDGASAGEVSHFKALTTALSATVGLGNIAGVAVALSMGGPGAIVWMIIAGFIGMSSKFVECTLGVKFRQIDENGKVHGGPMYYLSEGFRKLGLGEIGTLLGGIFALMCIGGAMGGGNIFQVGSATEQIINFVEYRNIAGGEDGYIANNRWVIGASFAFIIGLVIIGGLVWIANVTSIVVPFMCGIYVISALVIIFTNVTEIPAAFMAIFKGAFVTVEPNEVAGGIIGAMIAGFRRAAFSNEAGIGSAAIAHSGVKTKHPASEGVVALLEPFIDTVVVCTMTALVIVITLGGDSSQWVNESGESLAGITLTTAAFKANFAWMGHVLTLAAVLFAFSTMISWCYYGMQSWSFLFGKSLISTLLYKFIFLAFIVIGSAMELGNVVDFSDAMIFAMAFPNVFAIFFFSPMVATELKNYLNYVKSFESPETVIENDSDSEETEVSTDDSPSDESEPQS